MFLSFVTVMNAITKFLRSFQSRYQYTKLRIGSSYLSVIAILASYIYTCTCLEASIFVIIMLSKSFHNLFLFQLKSCIFC